MNFPIPSPTATDVWARSSDDRYQLLFDSALGRFVVRSGQPGDPWHGTEFLARTLISFLIGHGARTDFRLEIRLVGTEAQVPFAVIHHGNRPLAAVCLSRHEPDFGRHFGEKLGDVSYLVVPYRVERNLGKLSAHALSLCALGAALRARNPNALRQTPQ
ncbi:MAG: hypothetical protein NTV51_10515 [Verrucomicrobia bacterium]|nr:hypothetical protein [Verrucomicrobiota bacterium]